MKERFYKWTTSKKIVASFLFLILVGSISTIHGATSLNNYDHDVCRQSWTDYIS